MHIKDDRYYIEKVIEGDSSAFAVLVDRHKTMSYNIALKIVHVQEDAEEITQDAFVKAYSSLRSFKGEAKFSTWLYRIVYNTAISHLRKRKREIPADTASRAVINNPLLVEEDGPGEDEFMAAALKRAVDSLPAAEQTMITLYYYNNSSIEDIASVMSLSASNVKVRLFRTRKKLYDQMQAIMDNGTLAGT